MKKYYEILYKNYAGNKLFMLLTRSCNVGRSFLLSPTGVCKKQLLIIIVPVVTAGENEEILQKKKNSKKIDEF